MYLLINIDIKNKNFIVGVGTLMTDHNIQNAINVGAKFGISPGISEELFEGCEKSNFPLIPGVSTPTEIMASYSRGYKVLKFFPATVLVILVSLINEDQYARPVTVSVSRESALNLVS